MGGSRQSVIEDNTLILGSAPPPTPQKKPHKEPEVEGLTLEFKPELAHICSLVLGALGGRGSCCWICGLLEALGVYSWYKKAPGVSQGSEEMSG